MRFRFGLFIFAFLFSVSAVAATEVDVLTKDFQAEKKKVEDADVKQRQVLSALYQLNKKIKKLVTERGETVQERAFLEVNIRQLSLKVQELERRSGSQKSLLAERLRAIYKLGGPSVARFIFSSSSSSDLERNLKILGIVASRDLELIKNYNQDLKELQKKREALASRLEKLKSVEVRVAGQEKMLRKEQELKNKLLDGIRRSKLFAINRINGLREKSLQYNLEDVGLFDLLFKPSFADQKGLLPLPTQGTLSQRFGLVKNEDHGYTVSNKGIYISAAQGTPVKSVFGGRISYVGEIPGYGATLIVDHGDHYYSVYSHTQDVTVAVGDEVEQQQQIALIGTPPVDQTPGIYFEIRHFSEPYDPQQWMKGL